MLAPPVSSNVGMDDTIIGRRLFTDGVPREVYLDEGGQYVLDDANEKVYGVWILTDDELEDLPSREQLPDLPFVVEAPRP